ncbi:helix-turn-helix domain-containing protein [Streptomyces sp. URMC 123]|uniref:helix-turn-helix domain-containing protein n=1 Tax=Streptomyces sp. URMC 123 TaxID=3423403 RepID=UPI003F1D322B
MPRWRALPDELDPQVREFASQLRRLVDRSGLSISAVADRTGYSKTSWERYLNGRLLPPQRAVMALAEVTGTNPQHLTTMWELAERAWSRSEMRHDVTMEAIRVAQARAALSEFGATPAGGSARNGRESGKARTPARPAALADQSAAHDGFGAAAADPGRADSRYAPGSHAVPEPDRPAWPGTSAPGTPGPAPGDPARADGGRGPARRKLPLFLAGAVGVLLLIVAAVLLLDGGEDEAPKAAPAPQPSPAATTQAAPEATAPQAKCSGAGCTGKDPEGMGCGGQHAQTVARTAVGTAFVEVRYSKVCGAAWARLTQAAPGDSVRISGSRNAVQSGKAANRDAYTQMVMVASASDAKACATLVSGKRGCAQPAAGG